MTPRAQSASPKFSLFGNPTRKLDRARQLLEQGASKEGMALLGKLARDDLPGAQYLLGMAYLEGRHIPQHLGEALEWLNKAAANSDAEAQFRMAQLSLTGLEAGPATTGDFLAPRAQAALPKDGRAALEWAMKAANQNHPDAQALAAHIRETSPDGLQDRDAARDLYRRSAEGGSMLGIQGLGSMLWQEAQTPEKRAEALVFLKKAAAMGAGPAHFMVGTIEAQGVDRPADPIAAAQSFERAAELGVPGAQMRLGLAYFQGLGVERDTSKAETWLRKAATGGEIEAAALVGDINLQGGGLPPNFPEAIVWYRKASEGGHVGAMVTLGQLLFKGMGAPADRSGARALFYKAATEGNQQATDLLHALDAGRLR